MTQAQFDETDVDQVKSKFLSLTGLTDIKAIPEQAGPEVFLRFVVGREAPLYRRALDQISSHLPADSPFHGALSLRVEKLSDLLASREVELLRSLISRSLQVTSAAAEEGLAVEFVPFRGGEDQRTIQPTNHAILGRRGVGKSSLILMVYRRVLADGNLPVWLDLQAYRGRTDERAILEVTAELFDETVRSTKEHFPRKDIAPASAAIDAVKRCINTTASKQGSSHIRECLPSVRSEIRKFTRALGSQVFVFLDDAHVIGSTLQPELFDFLHSVFKGSGGWLKIAGVKNLTRLYDPSTRTGLQSPNDVQIVSLDLTLVDPGAAREHLMSILQSFLAACGIPRSNQIITGRAIDRLVWCSAGVPRDFLSLFNRSIGFALQHRRRKVGVEEVNLAVGESGQDKMAELEQNKTQEGVALQNSLNRLQRAALDKNRSNSFLIRQEYGNVGYMAVQKLMDLRLLHLIHPSITPSSAGEKYEAYLLDYSFYTGVRRRHGLKELKINVNEPPRYGALRQLPRIDLSEFS